MTLTERPPGGDEVLLSLRGLLKDFGGTRAIDHADLDVRRSEIHALLGENGAGKSTIIKILAGLYEPDAGEIIFGGEQVHPTADRLPVGFIHQDLALIDSMTVAENIALVAGFSRTGGMISWRQVTSLAVEALARVGGGIDPDAIVSSLAFAEKSIVAIARALAIDVEMLVLDEPTAALPDEDADRLFDRLRTLRRQGVSILYVTHRLDEVFRLADRITVIRDGRRIATSNVTDVTPAGLVEQIVGRRPEELPPHIPVHSSQPLLEVKELRVKGAGPVSFAADPGEILALVGLRGAGQESIGRALFGDNAIRSGEIVFNGSSYAPRHPWQGIQAGVGFVSGRRADESIAATLSVSENLFLNPTLNGEGKAPRTGDRAERQRAVAIARRFDIRPPLPDAPIATLSGGNQQKVVLARWLMAGCRLLILEEPTAGIDIGAKTEIYAALHPLLDQGGIVLLVSSDFEEVVRMAGRALVFHRGRVVARLEGEHLTRELLTHEAAGGRLEPVETAG